MRSNILAQYSDAKRVSNIELLRILAMSIIVLHHMMIHGLDSPNHSILYNKVSSFIYPLLEIGVNLFFMISGYFGVKLRFQSILKLALVVFLFTIINYIICLPFGIYPSAIDITLNIFFPISRARYWFISVYLGIIILSPLINSGLNNLSKNQLRCFIIIFTCFTVYSCGIAHNTCNPSGYTFLQGVYMYCLAHFIHTEKDTLKILSKKTCLTLFSVAAIISGIGMLYTSLGPCFFENYNGLFIILMSTMLFILFTKISYQNSIVNYIASSALGCYLIQDGFFGTKVLYPFLEIIGMSETSFSYRSGIFIAIFFATWIASIIISPFVNYISNGIVRITEGRFPKMIINTINEACIKKYF